LSDSSEIIAVIPTVIAGGIVGGIVARTFPLPEERKKRRSMSMKKKKYYYKKVKGRKSKVRCKMPT